MLQAGSASNIILNLLAVLKSQRLSPYPVLSTSSLDIIPTHTLTHLCATLGQNDYNQWRAKFGGGAME